jgi:hypothetical protein
LPAKRDAADIVVVDVEERFEVGIDVHRLDQVRDGEVDPIASRLQSDDEGRVTLRLRSDGRFTVDTGTRLDPSIEGTPRLVVRTPRLEHGNPLLG